MCQIWIKPKGIMLPRVFWDAINDYNQEGLGVYNITKDFIFKTEDYEKGWEYIQENIDDQMIVHHRLATSGACSLDQLHGWDMGNGHVFFHNGILRSYSGTATLSDTQEFVQEWQGVPLKPMIKYLEEVESSSRFVLVNRETKEVHLPQCATWNPVYIEELGMTIQFSNDYAFSYNMLPARYGRWGATGSGNKTRSGATSKKAFRSVFETEKLSYLLAPYAEDTECKHGAIKMYQYADSKFRSLNKHRARTVASQGYLYGKGVKSAQAKPTELYLNAVYNIDNTNNWITGSQVHKILTGKAKKWSQKSVISADKAYTANDLISCGDKDIARAYLLVTRERGQFQTYTTSVTPFIAGYERGIGERVKPLSLVDLYALAEIAHQVLAKDKSVQMSNDYINAFVATVADLMDNYAGTLSDEQRSTFSHAMQEEYHRLAEAERQAKLQEAQRLAARYRRRPHWADDDGYSIFEYNYGFGHNQRVASTVAASRTAQAMRTHLQTTMPLHDEQTVYELVKAYNAEHGTAYEIASDVASDVAQFMNDDGEDVVGYMVDKILSDGDGSYPYLLGVYVCSGSDLATLEDVAEILDVDLDEVVEWVLPQN